MTIHPAIHGIRLALLACMLFAAAPGRAQAAADSLTIIEAGRDCSIRGMSIARDGAVWVSGSNGHVGRSVDSGASWIWQVVSGYEQTDFRDIHAFDSLRALIMGIGNPANTLKTVDGGRTWKLVYTKRMEGMFLDALDFRNDTEGICIGDPVDDGSGGKAFFVLRTADGGDTWTEAAPGAMPPPAPAEAMFSASGTNIALLGDGDFDYAAISGGAESRLYLIGRDGRPDRVYPLALVKGRESAGAFSLATDGRQRFYCIGGDYKEPELAAGNFVWTTDGGRHWQTAGASGPSGYRSCIRMIAGDSLVACGPNGVDLCGSPHSWSRISSEGFHVCAVSPDKRLIFFAGGKGKIGLLRL